MSAQSNSDNAIVPGAASVMGAGSVELHSRRWHLPELIIPREHGAWAMVSLPFITGAIIAGSRGGTALSLATLAAALATLSIFMLRTPLATLWRMTLNAPRLAALGGRAASVPYPNSKGNERYSALVSSFVYGAVASAAGCYLLWVLPPIPLILMGTGAVVLTVATLFLVVRNYQRYPALQIASAVGLTASSLPGYLAARGHLEPVAFGVWALFAAHSAASVLVVHAQLESVVAGRKKSSAESGRPHRRNAWIAQVSLWLALAAAAIPGRPWLIVPFLPACILHTWNLWCLSAEVPGGRHPEAQRISMKRVGITNLGASIVFCLLLIILVRTGQVILP